MGKNKTIKSLGKCIGNVVLHKILLEHTNKPESKKHLKDEIKDYGADIFDKAQEFSWSDKEKTEIKDKAIKRIKNIIQNYPDMAYDEKESMDLIDETMEEMLL